MKLPEFDTHQEAKDYLRANWKKGCHCPTCGQTVKLYKYKFDASKAMAAIGIYKLDKHYKQESFHLQRDFVNLLKLNANNLHYTKMKYYDFIERDSSKDDPKKGGSGWWFGTQQVRDFVEGKTRIPSVFYVYDGRCIGFGNETISVKEALAEKFDYEELMAETII